MPASDYGFRLYAPDGKTQLVAELEATYAQYVDRLHERGRFYVRCQASEVTVASYDTLAADARFIARRQPDGAKTATLEHSGLCRAIKLTQSGQEIYLELAGYAQNELLARRIVDAPAADADAKKAGAADDVAIDIVREQLGDEADSARDLTAAGFTVQGNTAPGLCTNVEKEFARRNVMEVLQEIADQSRDAPSTALWWGFVPTGEGLEAEFRTRSGLWGQDLTGLITFSLENGNMQNPVYTYDRSEEINHVYGAGSGIEDDRIEAADQADAARIAASPLNRREGFYDLRNETDTDVIESGMLDLLYQGNPVRRLTLDVQQTPGCRYGVHYHLGDKVRGAFAGMVHEYVIMARMVTVEGERESIKIVLEEY